MKFGKKQAIAASIAAFAMLGLTACGGGDADNGKAADNGNKGEVTIEYWHRLPDKDGMIKVNDSVAEFNKEHAGKIKVVAKKFEGNADDSYEKISAAVKAGNAPCLVQASYDGIPAMLVRGELQDVSKYAEKYKDNYAAGAYGSVTLGGKTFGLPQDTGPLVYFYDKDAFAALGLEAPKTWDEYWANAEKAKAAGKFTSAFFKDDAGDSFAAVNAANGAKWYGLDGEAWKVNVDGDVSKQVAEAWQKSIADGSTFVVARWDDKGEFDPSIKDGKLVGFLSAAWDAPLFLGNSGLDKANWGIAQAPGDMTGFWGGSGLVVTKDCKYPEQTLEFANWYNTNMKAMASQGLVPAAKGNVENPEWAKWFGGVEVMKPLMEAADRGNPDQHYAPTWPAVKKGINDAAGKLPDANLPEILKAAQDESVKTLEAKGLKVTK